MNQIEKTKCKIKCESNSQLNLHSFIHYFGSFSLQHDESTHHSNLLSAVLVGPTPTNTSFWSLSSARQSKTDSLLFKPEQGKK